MIRFLTIMVLAAFSIITPVQAQNFPVVKCDIELFKHQESDQTRRASMVYFLDLVTQENFSEIQKNLKASWDGGYGFFDTSFAALEVKRTAYRKEVQYKNDEKSSRDYAVSTLKSEGLAAYKACLETIAPDNSLMIALEKDTPVGELISFSITVKRNSNFPEPLTASIYGLNLQRLGNTGIEPAGDHGTITWPNAIGYKLFTVPRASVDTEFRVTANYGNLPVHVLVVPKRQPTTISVVSRPVSHSGTFFVHGDVVPDQSSGRAFQTVDSDHGWKLNEVRPVPPGTLSEFTQGLCLCASDRYNVSDGSCLAASGPDSSAKLNLATIVGPVSPAPECGGEGQPGPTSISPSPIQVCYSQTLRIRSTIGVPRTCTHKWGLSGEVLFEREVFDGS